MSVSRRNFLLGGMGLAGILSSSKAPAAIVRSTLGARAMDDEGISVPNAEDYVQNGLVAMWDGIENVDFGVHAFENSLWHDLTGNNHDWMLKTAVFDDNSIIVSPNSATLATAIQGSDIKTLEIGIKAGAGYCVVFFDNYHRVTINPNYRMQFGAARASNGFIASNGYKTGTCIYGDNSSVLKVYADGRQQSLSTWTDWTRGNNNALSVNYSSAYNFSGSIYFIRIYSRNLSDEEIAYNYSIDQMRFGI